MINYILNWLRGFAYLADGFIILLTIGLVEPDLSIRMDSWFISRVEREGF